MKREGVLAGAPDLLVAEPRNGNHGLFVEMKRQDGGRTSKDQLIVHASLMERGYAVHIHDGADSAYLGILRYVYGQVCPEKFPETRMILARTGA
jgi:hypothetical protein